MAGSENNGTGSTGASQLLARGLKVLESVAAHSSPVGVGDLARDVELPKSTVQRILGTLAELGWIESTEDPVTRWQLTDRMLMLSRRVPRQVDLRQAALPHMRWLQAETLESLYLTVPNLGTGTMVLIEKLDSTLPVRAYTPIGSMIPMRAAAIGKAVLAALSDEKIEEILRIDVSAAATSAPLKPEDLWREIEETRKNGYAVARGEWRSGICAVAAAVLDEHAQPIASLGVSTPAFRFSEETIPALGAQVKKATRAIERDFNGF